MTQTHALLPETEQLAIDGLADSERYRLLANETRRRALRVLTAVDGQIDLHALAAAMGEGDDGSSLDRDRLTVSLHHVHLPTLADAAVIEYNPETRTVSPDGLAGT